jgi:hypothetical protein
MDVIFISDKTEIDPGDTNIYNLEDGNKKITIEILKIEIQILKKRTKKNKKIIKIFFNAINIVADRLIRVENLIRKYDWKYFDIIIFFQTNFNRADGRVFILKNRA